jgi:hypothetical protein
VYCVYGSFLYCSTVIYCYCRVFIICIQWRLRIEEFGPTFLHIKGEKNVIADALSRLDANFNEKLPTEPTNDNMAYIFLTMTDIKETDFC